jgi:hypothetical protein
LDKLLNMDQDQLAKDLAFVREAIEANQRAGRVDVLPLLIWGLSTSAAAGVSYLFPAIDSVWLWVVVIGLAWIYTALRALRPASARPPQAFANRVLTAVWGSMLAAMTVIGFGGAFSGVIAPPAIPPTVACLLGAALLASSGLMRQQWLGLMGLTWWCTGIALFFLPAEVRLGVFGLAMVLFLVVPLLAVLRSDRRR